MTTSLPTAYTPLETLLLFQALRSEGVNSYAVFNRISDQLKSIPLIRNHPSYDGGRLSPDALRELYLWLLKEEVKSDLERQSKRESLLQNGDVSPGSRKRKAPSPEFASVGAASKHAALIPQLVTRLYARYRENTVREIREHERRYEAVSREIEEVGTGKREDKLRNLRTASATQSPQPSSPARTQATASNDDSTQPNKNSSVSPVSPRGTTDGNAGKPYTQNKIDSLINHEPDPQNGTSAHRRNSSSTTLPPLSEMAPQSPQFGIPPTIPAPGAASMQGHGFSHSPSSNQQSPFAPHNSHQMQNSLSRPSSSQRTLPPPPGMQLPAPSPVQTSNVHGAPLHQPHYPPQPPPHRLSTGPSPTNERPQLGYPPAHPPPGPGYYQQQPYLERRTSYPPFPQQHPSAAYPNQLPHTGAYPHMPFSGESQDSFNGTGNAQLTQQQSPVAQQSLNHAHGTPTYPQHPATAPSTAARPVRPPNSRLVTDIINALATPPRELRKPVWKSERRLPPIKVGTPVPRPEIEPLSPVLKRHEPPARSTRATRNRAATVSEQPEELESLPIPARARTKSKRDRSPHSVVSSTADESARMTRSQSVSTTTGVLPTSDDRPGSGGKVKVEPSTPAGFVDDTDTPHELPSGGRMTRKRRGTLHSLPQPPTKRKRQSVSALGDHEFEDSGTPPPRSNTVVATRNLHKLSSTIMNDINSHKHASYFANQVRDKDAPGYSEIIKQPQHLKSIRTALSAGTKAVNAAAAGTLDSPTTTETSTSKAAADGSATIELERTEDLIPPKGIVNAAQLEKEVLRMFANAIMFNPGEDGLVSDTREMFDDVDSKMREWRDGVDSVEKEAGENEDEEGRGKRRKL